MNALVPVHHTEFAVSDIERMAKAFASSKLFGIQNPDQALALCLVAQAEGRHPATAAQDYSIIQGRPSKKSDAMLRDFLASGGKVEWHHLDNEKADATFSHPAGGKVRIDWTLDRAKAAGLANNAMYTKYPRQMLRARVVSEGVRTVCPGATSGMYVPEEVQDFDEPRNVTPPRQAITETVREVRDEPAEEGPSPIFTACKAAIDLCEDEDALTDWKAKNAKAFEQMSDDDYRTVGAYWKARVKAVRASAKAKPQPQAAPADEFGLNGDGVPEFA